MLDENNAPVAPAGTDPQDTPPATPTPADVAGKGEKLGEPGLKALQSEREAREAAEKDLKAANARLKEIEDANLSELEKAQREAEESRTALAKLQRENDRNRVAIEKGVPSDLIEFITGDTAEDMAAKADLLVSRLNASPSIPKPDRTQGASGGERKRTTADQFADFFSSNIES